VRCPKLCGQEEDYSEIQIKKHGTSATHKRAGLDTNVLSNDSQYRITENASHIWGGIIIANEGDLQRKRNYATQCEHYKGYELSTVSSETQLEPNQFHPTPTVSYFRITLSM
jgi:hypothetical protein